MVREPDTKPSTTVFGPSVVLAPLAFLAAGATLTAIAAALAGSAHTNFIDIAPLLVRACWFAYSVCSASFLWIDGVLVRELPSRTWVSRRKMWLATVRSAGLGLGVGVVVGGTLAAGLFALGANHIPGTSAALVLSLLAVPAAFVAGLVFDVRMRLQTRLRTRTG